MSLQMKACARTLACTEEQPFTVMYRPTAGLGPQPKSEVTSSAGTEGGLLSGPVEEFRERVEAVAAADG